MHESEHPQALSSSGEPLGLQCQPDNGIIAIISEQKKPAFRLIRATEIIPAKVFASTERHLKYLLI